MAASKPCAAGGPARGHGAGFSPRQPPKFCRNIRNNCRKPCGPRQRAFRITRNTSATQAKLAGDSVAQRELNRIAPATPDVLPVLECCGVADKTAIFRGLPGDEFIGSLPDFYQNSLAGGVQNIFFEKLVYSETCLHYSARPSRETGAMDAHPR
jgi:hypothetical protein